MTQIVGKTKFELCPFINEWWKMPRQRMARGLTTSTIPFAHGVFTIDFDFLDHNLYIRSRDGGLKAVPSMPRSVADFYAEFMAALGALKIEANLDPRPKQFENRLPFEQDNKQTAYDPINVDRWRRILTQVGAVIDNYRAGFSGKSSQVQLYWGDFYLSQTRFSGKPSESPKGANRLGRLNDDTENVTAGFWPDSVKYAEPAFYSNTYPTPPGYKTATVRPASARHEAKLGQFVQNYHGVQSSTSPEMVILNLSQSMYEADAVLAHWDRAALEKRGSDVERNLGAKAGSATDHRKT